MNTIPCNSLHLPEYRLLRIPDVIDMTGVPRSTIYLKMKNKEFPQQVYIGTRSVAWVESEVLDWIKYNLEKRNK
ncbi:AlpA family transcriptional regulator [Pantoea sp. SOD02]|uniref:helix-turn-helix transcriptional regulator n=1 Tax=Pantoea sp. SOD02 TaxID=2970818 RepID=UPI00215763D5|nr:AlpA family transcriptional regulator [Pantoea sp. SOD02]UVC28254.1 AlpA family transcriptional regulator [Pantoea sp. SOD02]